MIGGGGGNLSLVFCQSVRNPPFWRAFSAGMLEKKDYWHPTNPKWIWVFRHQAFTMIQAVPSRSSENKIVQGLLASNRAGELGHLSHWGMQWEHTMRGPKRTWCWKVCHVTWSEQATGQERIVACSFSWSPFFFPCSPFSAFLALVSSAFTSSYLPPIGLWRAARARRPKIPENSR